MEPRIAVREICQEVPALLTTRGRCNKDLRWWQWEMTQKITAFGKSNLKFSKEATSLFPKFGAAPSRCAVCARHGK